MAIEIERRALQAAIMLACAVPLLAGGAGMITGAAMIGGGLVPSTDLDSHYRYLSGLLFGIGIAFLTCVPHVERKGARMRLLALIVLAGGLARAWSLAEDGWPSPPHRFALVMELIVVPLLTLWQAGWRGESREPQKPRGREPVRVAAPPWPAIGSDRPGKVRKASGLHLPNGHHRPRC